MSIYNLHQFGAMATRRSCSLRVGMWTLATASRTRDEALAYLASDRHGNIRPEKSGCDRRQTEECRTNPQKCEMSSCRCGPGRGSSVFSERLIAQFSLWSSLGVRERLVRSAHCSGVSPAVSRMKQSAPRAFIARQTLRAAARVGKRPIARR